MATPEFRSGRAEGLAIAIFGIAAAMRDPFMYPTETICDMAGWLVTNGGDQFVLDLAAAISRERHPANSEAADEPESLVVHWRIGEIVGHGEPIHPEAARSTVNLLNAAHGHGTHWTEVPS